LILDLIQNYKRYIPLYPLLEEGMEFALSKSEVPVGRYDRGNFYILVQEGETYPLEQGLYEAHRKYIDVQIVLKGEETVGWQGLSGLKECEPYSEEKDIVFFDGEGIPIRIKEGMFYLAGLQDAHKPCRYIGKQGSYRKIVLKIPVQDGC